jgi:uncharacterized damage-inducible protein DinB
MTGWEVTRLCLDDAQKQLKAVLNGFDDSNADTRIDPMMSARDMVAHLTECCIAAQKTARGEEHDWGSFEPTDPSFGRLLENLWVERDKATEALHAAGDDKSLKTCLAYLACHEFYHVGQLVALRLKVEPEWDWYAIYR